MFEQLVDRVRAGTLTADEAAIALLGAMTERERLGLLDGDLHPAQMITITKRFRSAPVVSSEVARLGYPGLRFTDGPRGVVCGRSTAFPVTMARGATWDADLESRVGLAMGRESRAQGGNYMSSICVNLLRHPAWGRAQETYGEDPVHLGRMGSALSRGVRRNVMSCVKHFALNSIENSRFKVDVIADDHALHEVYLPHFKAVIDSGADSVMSSYNRVNGTYAAENKVLLNDILRDEWGFRGFVTSDWGGVHDGIESLEAGNDVEMPMRQLRANHLRRALREGSISQEVVDASMRRIVSTTIAHAAQRDATAPSASIIASSAHRELAREVAARSMVVLKNEAVDGVAVLPLAAPVRSIAMIGMLAEAANLGDRGSSLVNPPTTSSPLAGLRSAVGEKAVVFDDGAVIERAAAAARSAEAAVVVVGMSSEDEGESIIGEPEERSGFMGLPPVKWAIKKFTDRLLAQFGRGGDRDGLALHDHDEKLIAAVAEANPRTIVVVIGGSAVVMESWRHRVPSILLAWYPGMEGGHALADVVLGAREPAGRLPFAIPTTEDHLPPFDPRAARVEYDEWWGQRKLDRDGRAPAFPFGFGLGTTTFEYELLSHEARGEAGSAIVRVRNTGARAGAAAPQLYAFADAPRAVPALVGFARVDLEPGEERAVEIDLDLTPAHDRDPASRRWGRRRGAWRLLVSAHSPHRFDDAVELWTKADAS